MSKATTQLKPVDFQFGEKFTGEVAFPGGFVVTIRYVPEIEERRIQVKFQNDVEKLLEERGKLRIVKWSGLTPEAFVEVCPDVELPDADENGEIPHNVHLAGQLYRYGSGIEFRLPIEDAHAELAREYRAKKKASLKS